MISLREYIRESLESESVLWRCEVWLGKHPSQRKAFYDIVDKCREERAVTKDHLDELVTKAGIKVKPFIDFIMDDVPGGEKDYMYLLKKAIESIIDDKSSEA